MSKEFNMAEGQALLDKLSMEDPAALIRAIAGEGPKSNGGPAFPWCGDLNECPAINLGMSLRDYFAAKAMSAVIMNPETQHELANMGRDEGMIVISKVAYMQADAMLAERAK